MSDLRRFCVVGALIAATVMAASTGIVPAASATTSSAQDAVCGITGGGFGKEFVRVTCTSGPGNEYRALVDCTHEPQVPGQYEQYGDGPGRWSEVVCPSKMSVIHVNVQTH